MILRLSRQLLDRQILDRSGLIVGNVDDIGFEIDDDGVPYVGTLLVGQVALGRRIGGRLGRLLIAVAARLAPEFPPRATEIPYHLVTGVGSAVQLSCRLDQLPEPPLEGWLRRHLIDRIPGAGSAGG
jgi:sporulation protein YlmC with PRC-barrel domain